MTKYHNEQLSPQQEEWEREADLLETIQEKRRVIVNYEEAYTLIEFFFHKGQRYEFIPKGENKVELQIK